MCGAFSLVVRKKIFKQCIARKWLPKENYFGDEYCERLMKTEPCSRSPIFSHETNTVARALHFLPAG